MKLNDYGDCAILIPETFRERLWLSFGELLGLVWWDACNFGVTRRIKTAEGWQREERHISIEDAAANPGALPRR